MTAVLPHSMQSMPAAALVERLICGRCGRCGGSKVAQMCTCVLRGPRPAQPPTPARLTTRQIADIVARYVPGYPAGVGVSTGNSAALAAEYGISQQYVALLARRAREAS
jgi:hypothetical protein